MMWNRLKFRKQAEAEYPGAPGARPLFEARARDLPPGDRLEDYLDRVLAPLVEKVPYDARRELRAELRSHLEALADAYEEIGSTPDEAARLAVEQFGDPGKLVKEWLRARAGCAEGSYLSPFPALGIGLVCFVPQTLFFVCLPGVADSAIALSLLFPVLAGLLVGVLAPSRAAFGAFLSAAVVTLVTAGMLALPSVLFTAAGSEPVRWYEVTSQSPHLPLVLLQSLWWMPASAAAGEVGERLRSRIRRAVRELLIA
jgi:hypothetical protein